MVFDPTHIVTNVEQLRTLYRMPHQLVIDKERPVIDDATREFILRAPFVLVGTVGGDGTADVSPRGGPSGFVQVLDDTHVAIADLSGNNRLDTLENIVANGQVGLLFVLPGQGETVRLNGHAFLSTEPAILEGFTAGLKPPKVAIVVEVVGTYIHCAKAMQRSRIWDPASWTAYAEAPDGAEILVAQQLLPSGVTAQMVRDDLDTGYARDLVDERA
ncbi:MAG: pyridoxamine 5-phosphate oxidase family protein [Ilumatobacteraceae bacterium]|nr:pyridoxamine 5-phosphate oxidase family protein [Ilumatobacteraceae bacterium]MCU1386789.1 pyridoxamine 5-phosphate oxidase family protein [Ilumatobacteraceae bacterium]